MSIGGTLRHFALTEITARRYAGFRDSGRYEKRLEESFTFRASVQPARPSDLERLPENYRQQGAFWIYPKAAIVLRTGSAAVSPSTDGVVADDVEINGVTYEIGAVETWRRHGRYLAARASQ